MINDLFGDAHLPFYARQWTFGTFPGSHAALGMVKSFVHDCLAGTEAKRGLYISGPRGRGKTGLAIAALYSLIERGHAGCFISTMELFSMLKESIGAEVQFHAGDRDAVVRLAASQGGRLLRLVRELEWLVLDDLGVECGSKYEIRELYLILEARRSQGLYTIFTSNLDAAGLARFWHTGDGKVFDDGSRIIARLGEYCLALPMEGAGDYRQKGRATK